MDWNDETITRLRALWAEGHSTAEIGRRLGVSKNAVVGKAHRLNLPARPSPIRRDAAPGARPRNPQPRRVTGPTLPSLAAPALAAPVSVLSAGVMGHGAIAQDALARDAMLGPVSPARIESDGRPQVEPPEPPSPVDAPPPGRPAAMRVVTPRLARNVACCWPLGEPGTKSFRFCDADAAPGKPYCAAHAQVAYVKVRDRREDAA
jgi:GcrA cell cycle regulator